MGAINQPGCSEAEGRVRGAEDVCFAVFADGVMRSGLFEL
jgi:hypothetical protein